MEAIIEKVENHYIIHNSIGIQASTNKAIHPIDIPEHVIEDFETKKCNTVQIYVDINRKPVIEENELVCFILDKCCPTFANPNYSIF